jgi:hypothetical protein
MRFRDLMCLKVASIKRVRAETVLSFLARLLQIPDSNHVLEFLNKELGAE